MEGSNELGDQIDVILYINKTNNLEVKGELSLWEA